MISIIMPVYNSEKYLSSATMSILDQTYPDFELLLIDDGSLDGSAEICDKFADKDTRVRVFHKENGGVCSARNLGMREAKGEYIGFIDNDDEYDPHYLEIFAELIGRDASDVLKCGRKNIRITPELEIISEKEETFPHSVTATTEEWVKDYLQIKKTGCLGSVWNGLYKRSFIEEHGLKFREDMKHGIEDLMFNYEVFLADPSVTFIQDVLYTHYYRISHSTSLKFYDDQIYSAIEAMKLERRLAERFDEDKKMLLYFEEVRDCFRQLSLSKDKETRRRLAQNIEEELGLKDIKLNKATLLELDKKQKLDWVLLSKRLYKAYFGYRDIQRKVIS